MQGMPWTRRLKNAGRVLSAVLLILLSGVANADLQDERRISVGLRLFPALIAANQDLGSRAGSDGEITILLLYRENPFLAQSFAERLGEFENIGGYSFRVEVAPVANLKTHRRSPPAGVFLAEWMPEALPEIVEFGIGTHTVVFSPFRSDVRKGVLGGLYVSDRILPYINMKTLRASELRIKPFFLEVAKQHEQGGRDANE